LTIKLTWKDQNVIRPNNNNNKGRKRKEKKRKEQLKPTSSRPGLVRCIPGPMITSQSGNTSTSLLYISRGKVAVTNRYCVVTGAEFIKLFNATSKPSSLKSISTSSNTALQHNVLINLALA
jgi:hypothetical protein